eukprot:4272642-Pyramimonas_sp.AAC.1
MDWSSGCVSQVIPSKLAACAAGPDAAIGGADVRLRAWAVRGRPCVRPERGVVFLHHLGQEVVHRIARRCVCIRQYDPSIGM